MELIQALQENRAEVERINGGPLSGRDLALIKALADAGELYESIGRKDAALGYPAQPGERFAPWGEYVAAHMYKRYKSGYDAERAALSMAKQTKALFQACSLSGMIRHPNVNNGKPVPVFSPKPRTDGKPSINTLEGWNTAVQEQNQLSFACAMGRVPADDTELDAWIETVLAHDSQG